MKTKLIALTIGILVIFIVILVTIFRWAVTIEFVQSPVKIEWQKAIIYRKEYKGYKFKNMQNKAVEGIKFIDEYYKEYPSELPTPTPTPKIEGKGEILPKKTIVESFPKYLTDNGASNREKALAWIAERWSGDDLTAFDNILKKESGYRADAVNEIGACGIGQAYPCEKMGCQVSDDDLMCQLEWVNRYIVNRYGSPSEAWSFHLLENYY